MIRSLDPSGTSQRNAQGIRSSNPLRALAFLALLLALLAMPASALAEPSASTGERINEVISRNVDWDLLKRASAYSRFNTVEASIEEDLTNLYGTSLGSRTSEGNSCILIPAHRYDINPAITVREGSAPCYVFAIMSDELLAIEDPRTSAEQLESNGWRCMDESLGIWRFEKIVDAQDCDITIPLMSGFTVRADWQPTAGITLVNAFTAVAIGETSRATVPESKQPGETPRTSDHGVFALATVGALALAAAGIACATRRRGRKEAKQ